MTKRKKLNIGSLGFVSRISGHRGFVFMRIEVLPWGLGGWA
jgi:hypothetical protein